MAAILTFCLSLLLANQVSLSNPPPNGESLSNSVHTIRQDSQTSYSTIKNDIFFSSFSSNVTNNYQERHSVTTEKDTTTNVIPMTSDRIGLGQRFTSNKDYESTKSMKIQHITQSSKLQATDNSETYTPVVDVTDTHTSSNQLVLRAQRPRRKKIYKNNSNNKFNSSLINSSGKFSIEHNHDPSISEQHQGDSWNNTVNEIDETQETRVYKVSSCTEETHKSRSSVPPEPTQSSSYSYSKILQELDKHTTFPEKEYGFHNSDEEKSEESQLIKPFKVEIFHRKSVDSKYHSDEEPSVRETSKEANSRTNGNTREWVQSNPHISNIVSKAHAENRKLSLKSSNISYPKNNFSIHIFNGNSSHRLVETTFNETIIENFSRHKPDSIAIDRNVSSQRRVSEGSVASAYDYINGRNVRHVSSKTEGSVPSSRKSETGSDTPNPTFEKTYPMKNQTNGKIFHISSEVSDKVNTTDVPDKGSTAYMDVDILNRKNIVEERVHNKEVNNLPVLMQNSSKYIGHLTNDSKSTTGNENNELSFHNGSKVSYSFTFNSYEVNPSTEIAEDDFYTYYTTPVYNIELTSAVENYTDLYVNQTNAYSYTADTYLDSYLELVSVNGSEDHNTSRETTNESALHVNVSGWPVKLSAVVEGEIVLGGLMMVHERSDTVTCGPVMPQGGVQALETMLYTLDRLNAHPSLLPNVTLGAHILDDCDKDTYGLEMAVDFIKGNNTSTSPQIQTCRKFLSEVYQSGWSH